MRIFHTSCDEDSTACMYLDMVLQQEEHCPGNGSPCDEDRRVEGTCGSLYAMAAQQMVE